MSQPAPLEPALVDLREEAAPAKLFQSLVASFVVAMMTVVLSISFVALIFVDPITGFVGQGVNLVLLTAMIMGVFMAVFSSYAGTIAIPQDRIAPIVALMASLIIRDMRGTASPEVIGITVLGAIAASAVMIGLVLFLLGAYKLGNVVRFIPYPVIGGFLAGSGWLLLTGSYRVISGESLSFQALSRSFDTGTFWAWMPCVVFGTVAYLAVRFSKHYLMLPGIVLVSFALFYLWLDLGHYSWATAKSNGWISNTIPDAGLSHVLPLPALYQAKWGVVLGQYNSLIALLLTSIVSILLNTTALELAADEDIDLNKELRAAGLANLFGGFAGGMIGFQSLSLSSLPVSMGVKSRYVGLFSALVCLLLLCFGTGLVGYLPRFILGGILFYNGLSFLTEWVFDSYFRLMREDYLLVLLILTIVAVAGYLQGIGAGIITAAVLFVLKYSSVNVVTYILSGDSHHSTVDRSPIEARLLNTQGGRIYILRLKGFIFFGSANNLLNTVKERFADESLPRLGYVILDFQHVSGLDTSGIVSISKLSRLAKKEGFLLIATSVPVHIQNTFRNTGLLSEGPGQIRLFRDRDHGTEWCENDMIKRELSDSATEVKSLPLILNEFHPWQADTHGLLAYMERLEVGKNHYLMLQGDTAQELYFIESGRVRVVVELDNGQTMRVRTMGNGTVVGEIGLYLAQQRLASVVTEEPCTVYRCTLESLHRMERENPALAAAFHEFMVRVLAERVTQQNRTLRALVE